MFSKKNKKPARLHPIDNPHKHDEMHLEETLVAISPIIIVVMVTILLITMFYCFGYSFATEANTWQRLELII